MVPTPFRACSPAKGACDANFFCDGDSFFCSPCTAMCDYKPKSQLPVDCRGLCLGRAKSVKKIPQRQQDTSDLRKIQSTASPKILLALAAMPTSLSPAFQQTGFTKGSLQAEHLAGGSHNSGLHSAGIGSLIVVLLLVVAALVVIVIVYMAVTIRRNNKTKPSKTVQAVFQNVEESREPTKSHGTDSNHKSPPNDDNGYGADQALLQIQGQCNVHSGTEQNHHLTNKLMCSLSIETVSDPRLQIKNTDNNCQCGSRETKIEDNGHSI